MPGRVTIERVGFKDISALGYPEAGESPIFGVESYALGCGTIASAWSLGYRAIAGVGSPCVRNYH